MATRHFTPSGWNHTTTYPCGACGKRTRDTGYGEGPVELCKACYIRCTVDNNHMDYGTEGGHVAENDTPCPRCDELTREMERAK